MVKVGIIGAMDEEVSILVKDMGAVTEQTIASMKFYSGKLDGKNVVIVKCGIGKVNAAVCTQVLISNFNVTHIILSGVAGAVDENLDVGDVVIPSDCVQWDVDATKLGAALGQICFTQHRFFRADKGMVSIALEVAKRLNIKALTGRILTGDKFITNPDELKVLKDTFGGNCIEMEGASVGHASVLNNIPFVIIRSISDKADHSAAADFNKFLNQAAHVSSSIVNGVVTRL